MFVKGDAAAPASNPTRARASFLGGLYKPFRMQLTLGALVLLFANLGTSVFVRQQHRMTVAHSVEIYDVAFITVNYIHRAQIAFQSFVAERGRAVGADEISRANEKLSEALDDLDVAIERLSDPGMRAQGETLRTQIAALKDVVESDAAELTPRLTLDEAAMAQLAQRASSIGLEARDNIEENAARNDFLLIGTIASSLFLAGAALLTFHGLITRMAHMASYDSLTKLPNRTYFHSRASLALVDARRSGNAFAVLSLDLDRFKNVNDTLGHHIGDLLLIEVSRRIEKLLRAADTLARFGGDEFVILQMSVRQPSEAEALAERVIAAVSAPYEILGQRLLIGASVGITLAPQAGDDVEDLLRNSDVALYRAKSEGKGRHRYFTSEMNAETQARRVMELDLRDALDNGKIDVFYQPLINISTGEVTACEALVRWTHPVRGEITPDQFIPLAEETGLIEALGEFVLRSACTEAVSWTRDIAVAVNLSVVQFRSGNLIPIIVSILAETGLDAKRLELEITKSVLIEEKGRVLQTLTALSEIGVRIALDDFGTGYSSLSYLSSFQFDKIKIDKSFVHDVTKRMNSAAIIRAILSLAGTLNMTTLAEGVEKSEELEWLRESGCQEAQGFLFSRAVSARDLRLLLGMRIKPRADDNLLAGTVA